MQTLVLSDHTGDQLAKRERGRQQKYHNEMARYNDEVASRDKLDSDGVREAEVRVRERA